jgi:hypothetical protein
MAELPHSEPYEPEESQGTSGQFASSTTENVTDDERATTVTHQLMATHTIACQSMENLDITKLNDICNVLKSVGFCDTDWFKLGLQLSIVITTLQDIEMTYENKGMERCLQQCLARWLQDDTPHTWSVLSGALRQMNLRDAANRGEIFAKVPFTESYIYIRIINVLKYVVLRVLVVVFLLLI